MNNSYQTFMHTQQQPQLQALSSINFQHPQQEFDPLQLDLRPIITQTNQQLLPLSLHHPAASNQFKEINNTAANHFQSPHPSPEMVMKRNSNGVPWMQGVPKPGISTSGLPTPCPSAPSSATSTKFHRNGSFSGLPSPGFSYHDNSSSNGTNPSTPTPRTRSRRVSVCGTGSVPSKPSKSLEKKYICLHANCGKSFDRPFNLRQHARTHNGEKPFPCEKCGKAFSRAHDLKRHVMAVHENIKPFRCYQCNHRFTRHDALSRHVVQISACDAYYKLHNIDPIDQVPSPNMTGLGIQFNLSDNNITPLVNGQCLSPAFTSAFNFLPAETAFQSAPVNNFHTPTTTNVPSFDVSSATKSMFDAFLDLRVPSPPTAINGMEAIAEAPAALEAGHVQVNTGQFANNRIQEGTTDDSWKAIDEMVNEATATGIPQNQIWEQIMALPTKGNAVVGIDTLERLMKEHDKNLSSNEVLLSNDGLTGGHNLDLLTPLSDQSINNIIGPFERRTSLNLNMSNDGLTGGHNLDLLTPLSNQSFNNIIGPFERRTSLHLNMSNDGLTGGHNLDLLTPLSNQSFNNIIGPPERRTSLHLNMSNDGLTGGHNLGLLTPLSDQSINNIIGPPDRRTSLNLNINNPQGLNVYPYANNFIVPSMAEWPTDSLDRLLNVSEVKTGAT